MLIRSHVLSATGISASNTLARTNLGTPPPQGTINSLELDFSAIAGGATQLAKLTLGWVNADRRYLVNAETTLTINLNADDATTGSYEIAVTKEFNAIPADATGIWLGLDLNAGTATVAAYLNIRGHA